MEFLWKPNQTKPFLKIGKHKEKGKNDFYSQHLVMNIINILLHVLPTF